MPDIVDFILLALGYIYNPINTFELCSWTVIWKQFNSMGACSQGFVVVIFANPDQRSFLS
jgi:hypothetical protein